MPTDGGTRADQLITRLQAQTGKLAPLSHGQFGATAGERSGSRPIRLGVHLLDGPHLSSGLGIGLHFSNASAFVDPRAVR